MEKVPAIFIRKVLYLNVITILILLFQPETSSAQANSVLGLVHDSTHDPLSGVEVFEIRHKDKINDTTNADGLYCIKIPKSCPNYQLQYQKKGYIDHSDPDPIPNNVDPKKRTTITLLSPTDLAGYSEQELKEVIGAQVASFCFAKQSKLPTVLLGSKANFKLISDNLYLNKVINWHSKQVIRSELKEYICQADYELRKLGPYKHE